MQPKVKSLIETHCKTIINELIGSFRKFPWEDRHAYAHWLGQTYYLVRHTPVFLSLSASKYGADFPEKLNETLGHLREETGHDQLALNDLQALGYSIGTIPELRETKLIYQTQYYWMEHYGPVAHSGYALMLEGVAALEGKNLLERVKKIHGEKPVSFIHEHALVDQKHFAHALNNLKSAPAEKVAFALENLEQSASLYQSMLQCVTEGTMSHRNKKVA